ncbi:MAG: HDOD domain-containing protein [Phycisphaerales bacterium]
MNDVVLNRVLSCRTLPSLPAVALQVLELTRDPNVTADQLAALIQGDPGLTTKLLKTVNSSYYGLSKPCANISTAVGLLGLNAVKSLALGFSLIDTTGRAAEGGFDLVTYWRRAVYSAAGARYLAKHTGTWDPEEAFVAALLQDMGMLAIRAALKGEYDAVLSGAPADHAQLCQFERLHLGFDHAEVGAALVQKWRLPEQLAETTRRHHETEAGSGPHADLVQIIQISSLASLAIVCEAGAAHLDRLRTRTESALGWNAERTNEFLRFISETGAQLSLLLRVNTGQRPDVAAILSEAHERLAAQHEQMHETAQRLQSQNSELSRQASTDALTGLSNRRHFDEEAARLFGEARRTGTPLSVAFIDADRFKVVNDTHGHAVGDLVLVELARRISACADPGARPCRFGGEEFAVLFPRASAGEAMRRAEAIRAAVEAKPVDVSSAGASVKTLRVTISIGVGAFEPANACAGIFSLKQMMRSADEAVYAAKRDGRNAVRLGASAPTPGEAAAPEGSEAAGTHSEGPSASPVGPRTILLVENDPLAVKLLHAVLGRTPGIKLVSVSNGVEAKRVLARPGEDQPDLVVTDDLEDAPGGITGLDVVRAVRAHSALGAVPVVVISADDTNAAAQRARAAGATAFFTKAQMCQDLGKWIGQITRLRPGTEPARTAAAATPQAA